MKRILGAFLITLVGIGLSWVFLRPKEWTSGSTLNRKIIAKVLEIRNDVNRQEEGRLLWSSISRGDLIYLGDKIKTGGLSFTMIELIDSASKLEIEENSTIVMSQGGKKLELNMLEGRVFIKQAQGDGSGVDLLSGGKKLDVKGDTAVSIGKDGSSNVESFERSKSIFGALSPGYSSEILSLENQINVNWVAQPKEEIVTVLLGESPLLLSPTSVQAKFADGRISFPAKPGINYWQLVTTVNNEEMKSPLMKVKLVRPISPSQIFPSDKEIVKVVDQAFDFRWIKGNTPNPVVVEVSRDSGMREIVLTEEVKEGTSYQPNLLLSEGEYFWKLKSKSAGQSWLESPVTSFTVHKGNSVLSPTPLIPSDNVIYYIREDRPVSVAFEWRSQEEARGYELKIRGDQFSRDLQSNDTKEVVNLKNPGTYFWEVYSQASNGKKSVLPIKRSFEIRDTGRIQWSMDNKNFLYLESLPIIILKWEKRGVGQSILKISSTPDMNNGESYQVQGRDFPYRVLKPGPYYAKVFGTDENGNISAESDTFEFLVQEAPLPPAPTLSGDTRMLKASPRGELSARVGNAKSSWLIITSIVDGKGRTVDERRFSDERLQFSGLLPGKYFLKLKFQDEYKRLGAESERLDIEVPEKSQIAAPKLKGIKVR